MQQIIALVEQHPLATWLLAIGLVFIVIGGWLFRRGRSQVKISLTAKSRGVAVAGDNSGDIRTGDVGDRGSATRQSNLISIVGVVVALIGVVVAALAWLFPWVSG